MWAITLLSRSVLKEKLILYLANSWITLLSIWGLLRLRLCMAWDSSSFAGNGMLKHSIDQVWVLELIIENQPKAVSLKQVFVLARMGFTSAKTLGVRWPPNVL
ncbi:hypothetical protein KP509_20G021900 [Ceratopteris richardii]|uniref:Uncharacterized protein n=1 Tax=Ceratopteris richardii TaxID=49495 RepID=A0A8T2SGT5_CERRI|nr:hypothetical protein KP509_20G021900 [Ceratopteris richardii]